MLQFAYEKLLAKTLKETFGIDAYDTENLIQFFVDDVCEDDITGNTADVLIGTITIYPFSLNGQAHFNNHSMYRFFIFDGGDEPNEALCKILPINDEREDWHEVIDPDKDYWHGFRYKACIEKLKADSKK